MREGSDVKPCGWPVMVNGEQTMCGKPAAGTGTALWDPEQSTQLIPMDLCQEHLDEQQGKRPPSSV